MRGRYNNGGVFSLHGLIIYIVSIQSIHKSEKEPLQELLTNLRQFTFQICFTILLSTYFFIIIIIIIIIIRDTIKTHVC